MTVNFKRYRYLIAICGFLAALTVSCATKRPDIVKNFTNEECQRLGRSLKIEDALDSLDLFSSLLYKRCYVEAIEVGRRIRARYRDENSSSATDVASVFLPDGSLSEYTLESYERTYLTNMMAHSFFNIGELDAATIELRSAYSESRALIYNHGDDVPNTFTSAVLWENLGDPDTARPFWKKMSELLRRDGPIRKFASERIRAIDENQKSTERWRLFWIGRFPELDYQSAFVTKSSGGYYRIFAKTGLPKACTSPSGILIPVTPWVRKIGQRYDREYHPDLNTKSWVRAPLGMAYGAVTFATGAALGVGGCLLSPAGCGQSIEAGGKLMSKSGDVVEGMLKPDLRHWQSAPAALLATKLTDIAQEKCWKELEDTYRQTSFEISRAGIRPATQP